MLKCRFLEMRSMNKFKYAIELVINFPDSVEERCLKFISSVNGKYETVRWQINNIEATGPIGRRVCDEIESKKEYVASADEILNFFKEDGQIIELDLEISGKLIDISLLIRDGMHVNILSDNFTVLNESSIGQFNYLDLSLFEINIRPNEHDCFELLRDINPVIKKGMIGVILMIFEGEYLVEFVKDDGTNYEFEGEYTFQIVGSDFKLVPTGK